MSITPTSYIATILKLDTNTNTNSSEGKPSKSKLALNMVKAIAIGTIACISCNIAVRVYGDVRKYAMQIEAEQLIENKRIADKLTLEEQQSKDKENEIIEFGRAHVKYNNVGYELKNGLLVDKQSWGSTETGQELTQHIINKDLVDSNGYTQIKKEDNISSELRSVEYEEDIIKMSVMITNNMATDLDRINLIIVVYDKENSKVLYEEEITVFDAKTGEPREASIIINKAGIDDYIKKTDYVGIARVRVK